MRGRIILIFVCSHFAFLCNAQSATTAGLDTSNAAVKFLKNWENDFLDIGVSIHKDSFHIGEEAKRLLLDSVYRKTTYPTRYTWLNAMQLMNNMDLKKAYWHLLNLYHTDSLNKQLVLQTFVLYDSLVDMEKILTNTFYTYALTDPEVCVFKVGKPNITRPDILESKFDTLKEIIYIVKFNRKSAVLKR